MKTGIINILNGKKPVEITDNTPIIQIVTLLFIGLLIGMFIYLFRKNKEKKHFRKGFWRILGISCICLSAGLIPALIYATGSPWNTIRLFSPDIALLSMISVTLLALNGILSVVLSCKK